MNGAASSSASPSGVQGVCPAGWHLPSDAEWTELTDYLGGESLAGGKLKETGTTHWAMPNIGATNETGFTALPGGLRYHYGEYGYFGEGGIWHSATKSSRGYPWYRFLQNSYTSVYRDDGSEENGLSVRCVRD